MIIIYLSIFIFPLTRPPFLLDTIPPPIYCNAKNYYVQKITPLDISYLPVPNAHNSFPSLDRRELWGGCP